MLTADFSKFFNDSYRKDVFRYTEKKHQEIIDGKWNPNTEETFKKILRKIKSGKGYDDPNLKEKNGKYWYELVNGKNYMTVFFIPIKDEYTEILYLIHSLKIGNCPDLVN